MQQLNLLEFKFYGNYTETADLMKYDNISVYIIHLIFKSKLTFTCRKT